MKFTLNIALAAFYRLECFVVSFLLRIFSELPLFLLYRGLFRAMLFNLQIGRDLADRCVIDFCFNSIVVAKHIFVI